VKGTSISYRRSRGASDLSPKSIFMSARTLSSPSIASVRMRERDPLSPILGRGVGALRS
jgi:hypothetical protein